MAYFCSREAILAGEPIDVFNHGEMQRDFTYIDDIVEGVVRVLDRAAAPDPDWSGDAPDPARSRAPYRIYNIGNNQPVELLDFIAHPGAGLGKQGRRNCCRMQPGDVPATYADIDDLTRDLGFKPATPIEAGIARFVAWYRDVQPERRWVAASVVPPASTRRPRAQLSRQMGLDILGCFNHQDHQLFITLAIRYE